MRTARLRDPSPTVISIVEQLLERGQVSHAFLGITEPGRGRRRRRVCRARPAADGGLQSGDVIAAVDGQAVA
jgi:S1-C subfamily serine protease